MDDSKILRKNQFDLLPINITCDRISAVLRICVECPIFNDLPVIREQNGLNSEHPMLRPFNKFFNGDKNIGKVTYVYIMHDKFHFPIMVCSIVTTQAESKERRILVFPAWGKEPLKALKGRGVGRKESSIDHITIEEKFDGEVSIHLSSPRGEDRTKIIAFPSASPKLKTERRVHLFTIGVNNYQKLDSMSKVCKSFDNEKLKRFSPEQIKEIMKNALSKKHPLFWLPFEFEINSDAHLEFSFALIEKKLDNVDIPKLVITQPKKESIEQVTNIPIDEDRSLSITFTECPEKLPNDFIYAIKRK